MVSKVTGYDEELERWIYAPYSFCAWLKMHIKFTSGKALIGFHQVTRKDRKKEGRKGTMIWFQKKILCEQNARSKMCSQVGFFHGFYL